MRGCTCRGLALCDWCASLARRAGVVAPLEAPPAITEKAFMQAVTRYAREHSWLVYHTHDSRRSLPGYPDLTLCRVPTPDRPGQVIWAELKGEDTLTTLQQWSWLRALGQVTQTEAHLWKPEDWPQIVEALGR